MPSDPEQSTSTRAPSAGSLPLKAVPITHGSWNSRLTMPMWLPPVPLVEGRREEGGTGVSHQGDDAIGARVEQSKDVVGRLQVPARAGHRLVVEHLLPPPHLLHLAGIVALGR